MARRRKREIDRNISDRCHFMRTAPDTARGEATLDKLKKRYRGPKGPDWLRKPGTYFRITREPTATANPNSSMIAPERRQKRAAHTVLALWACNNADQPHARSYTRPSDGRPRRRRR